MFICKSRPYKGEKTKELARNIFLTSRESNDFEPPFSEDRPSHQLGLECYCIYHTSSQWLCTLPANAFYNETGGRPDPEKSLKVHKDL
jgi:hypothetical protein